MISMVCPYESVKVPLVNSEYICPHVVDLVCSLLFSSLLMKYFDKKQN